ncbi:zf-HC2 domain-containing protein [bacterium]|nr:zf-HC2 domain-containing protein [bacterium]
MNCRRFRKVLDDYLLGSLSESESIAIEAHAKSCEDCREELEAASRLHKVLATVDEPASTVAGDWQAIENRIWARLKNELESPANEGWLKRILDVLFPQFAPRPAFAFGVSMGLVVVGTLVLGLFWLSTSQERIAWDNTNLIQFWCDEGTLGLENGTQIASIMTGVERILAEDNGYDAYSIDTDAMLKSIASEMNEEGLEPGDLEASPMPSVLLDAGDFIESDLLNASRKELESAIESVFSETGNGA